MSETQQKTKPKILPNSINAEKLVLGCMLIDEYCTLDGIDLLIDDDFSLAQNKLIFKAIVTLFKKEIPIDIMSVTDYLTRKEQIEQAGGAIYITEISDVPTTANFSFYLDELKKYSDRRRVMIAAKKIYHAGFDLDNDEYISQSEELIYSASRNGKKQEFAPIKSVLANTAEELMTLYKNKGAITGISTGLDDLDALTCGFMPGQLIIIGARPSIGKTALALNIATNIASTPWKEDESVNQAVAFFSLEMTANDLVKRILSATGRIEGQHLKNGQFTNMELAKLKTAGQSLLNCQLFIDQTSSLTPIELNSRVRRLKAAHPNLSAVVVDYLQLMDSNKQSGNRQEDVSFITRSLKSLAMDPDINLPIIALSQLNRESEKNVGKNSIPPRPRLAQLKESGSIEQDADLVLLLHRPGFYSNDPEYSGKCEIDIVKQRNGPVGIVDTRFETEFSRFGNI